MARNDGRRQTRRQVEERKLNKRWRGMLREFERRAEREVEQKEEMASVKKLDDMRKEIAELKKEMERNDKTCIYKFICNFLFWVFAFVIFCIACMVWCFIIVVNFL